MKNLKHLSILCCLLFVAVATQAQSVSGKLVDGKNEPLAYANVVLQTADSVYITGTITHADGTFKLAKTDHARLIHISFIGYTPFIKRLDSDDMGVIQLLPDTHLLGEVVVKGNLPKTQLKGDAMITTVDGSVLEKAGTAENLLDKIPNVTAQDGEVQVFGRGTPEIYINGRKVRDNSELDRLSSESIKSVEVVSNPGARYDASVKAVIRIITKKKSGEGFGVDNRTVVRHREKYGWSISEQVDVNYRKNGLDVSAMLYGGSLRNGSDQIIVTETYLDKHWKQNLDLSDQIYKSKNIEVTVSLNYQFDENHTMGVRYNLERTPKEDFYIDQWADTYCNDQLYESLYSYIHTGELATYHRSNIYYNGKINDWNIDFNADGLWNDTKNTQETDEKITEGTSGNTDRSVTTIDTKRNELYAAKLVVSRPLAKGNFSLGAEYSHNSRNTTYYNAEGIIENNEAQIKEGATSAFIQYDRRFNQIYLQTGLRYEHVAFDYYDAGKHVDEQSKKYNHVFPSISLSFPVKKIQMQLGYARDITRPSYWNLRTNTTYVNRYTYETGNPFLMPSISDNITWSTSYKWLNVYVGYSHIKDAIVNQTVTYSENDPTVSLLTVLNSPDYDKVSASVNLSPQMGIWNPRLNLYVEKQWYWAETPDGKEMFGTPLWMIRFSNNLRLPKGFLLDVTGSFVSKGHSENVCMNKPGVDMSASLHKSFFNESLIVQLNANNILESKQNVTIYSGIRSLQQTQVLHRQISLTLRYKFNTTQSKYKGTGAGQSQKKRM